MKESEIPKMRVQLIKELQMIIPRHFYSFGEKNSQSSRSLSFLEVSIKSLRLGQMKGKISYQINRKRSSSVPELHQGSELQNLDRKNQREIDFLMSKFDEYKL